MERLFKWSWVLFCYFIVWLAKPDSKMLCILLFEIEYSLEFVSTNPPFFIRFFRHQDSNRYYLVIATAKIPKICKHTSLDVYFLICKSQDCTNNYQWVIQPKLIDCPSNTFISNFVIAPSRKVEFLSKITSFLPLKFEYASYLFLVQRVSCTFYDPAEYWF